MNKVKLLISNELKFWWWDLKGDKVPQTIVFLLSAFFLGILLLGKQSITNNVTNSYTPSGLLVGYLTFIIMGNGSFIGRWLGKTTYAQLDLSEYGVNKIFLIRSIYDLTFTYLKLITLTIVLSYFFKVEISINYITTYLILMVGILPYLYLNLSFAYILLIFQERKVVTNSLTLIVMSTPLLLLLDVYPFNLLSLFPYLSSASIVKLGITKGVEFSIWWYIYIVVQSLVYTYLLYRLTIYIQQWYKRVS